MQPGSLRVGADAADQVLSLPGLCAEAKHDGDHLDLLGPKYWVGMGIPTIDGSAQDAKGG
jgi:hypothetical protein